jgi:hypothetical protein
VRFSDSGVQLCSVPAAVASPTNSISSASISHTSSQGRLSAPRSVCEMAMGPVVRSYKRGRFAVEEAFLRCPVAHVVRSVSCPEVAASSCSSEARMRHSMDAVLLGSNSSFPTQAAGEAQKGQQGVGHASDAWGLDEDGDGVADLPPCRRHTTVSYFRRGRFLVQTVV